MTAGGGLSAGNPAVERRNMLRTTYARVSLRAIRHNVEMMRACLSPDTQFLAVVKADAYGHGAVPVARACLEAGAARLAVAIPEEGIELREAGITAPIHILGTTEDQAAEEIVSHTDIVLFDVKTADAEKFQQVVKGDFSIFAENFRRFAESQARLIVRIPVIPGFNDDENSIDGILTFLNAQQARVQEVSLLPFHRIGFDKYKRLKRQWLMGDTKNLDQKAIEPLKERFVSEGYRIFPS